MSTVSDATGSIERAFRAACAEINRRVQAGETAVVGTLLQEPLTHDPEVATELIFTEFVTRETYGQTPTKNEYFTQFPAYADRLRRLFDVDELLKADEAPRLSDMPRLGVYELGEKLGAGAMGVVYRGHHPVLQRDVAIKVLALTSTQTTERFIREGRAIAGLNHPHIVQLYEIGEADGQPFLVMEYVAGGTLRDYLSGRLLPAVEAAILLAVIAEAVQHAHTQGILHRDLKPANILLAAPAEALFPKVTDFGLAARLDHVGSITANLVGTPGYMAPEQASGGSTLTPAADVYSLGAVLYELLVGRPPFLSDSPTETLLQLLHADPLPPRRVRSEVPRDLETICLKCLHKNPQRRYPTATALADDLRRFVEGMPIQARRVGMFERGLKFARRRPVFTATLGVFVLALLVMFVGWAEFTRQLGLEVKGKEQARRVAERQREVAEEQREVATKERSKAFELLAVNREYQYVARLQQASASLPGDPARALTLLETPDWCPPERRDFAWHYLHASTKVERHVSTAKIGGINAFAHAPDGTFTVVGGLDGSLCGLTPTGKELFRIEQAHAKAITGLAILPDSKSFVAASFDGVVRWWDVRTAKLLRELGPVNWNIYALTLAPDGVSVYVGGGRALNSGTVAAWRLPKGDVITTPPVERSLVRTFAWAPDAPHLLIGHDSGAIVEWDHEKAALGGRFVTGIGRIQALSARRDGLVAVAGPGKYVVELWDRRSKQKTREIRSLSGAWAMQFSPDGSLLAMPDGQQAVVLVRVADQAHVARFVGHQSTRPPNRLVPLVGTSLAAEMGNIITGIQFTKDNELLSTGCDGTLRTWAVDPRPTPDTLPQLGASMTNLLVGNDRWTAYSSGDDARLYTVDLHSGTATPQTHPAVQRYMQITLSANGKYLHGLIHGLPVKPPQQRRSIIETYSLPDFKLVQRCEIADAMTRIHTAGDGYWLTNLTGHLYYGTGTTPPQLIGQTGEHLYAATYVPSLQRLLTFTAKKIDAWDTEGNHTQMERTFAGSPWTARAAPDGVSVLVYTMHPEFKGTLSLWNTKTDTVQVMHHGRSGFLDAAWSPDGRTLATTAPDRKISLLNVASGDQLLTLDGGSSDYVQGMVFTPDQRGLWALRGRVNPVDGYLQKWRIEP